MEKRFGETQVCSVGTYTTMKLKGAIKDLAKLHNIDFQEANLITSIIEDDDKTMTDLFKRAAIEPKLKKFIQKNWGLFYELPLLLGQPKARSVHACALMVFPQDRHMKHWTPVVNHDGLMVSEYEGTELDGAGFLKFDVLGIKQLDKFKDILRRIEANGKEVPDIYNLPLDDEKVYGYFSQGWNSDVFQFGSQGLTGYTKQLKPSNIDDLIACVALYRPGAMEHGFHEEYIKRKNGESNIEYIWGTEEILKDTYGLLVFQESVLKICSQLGNISPSDSSKVLKALGKKKVEVLKPFESQFLKGVVDNGGTEEVANELWGYMLSASLYLFNLSHSAAYAITGYIGQWLKVHYPLEYWATAFSFADEDHTPRFLSEIRDSGIVKVMSPDINLSETFIQSDAETNSLFWALSSIKNVGEKATDQIMAMRPKRGYSSLSEFVEIHNFKGSKVNKRVYEGLILSGAFDGIEGIDIPRKRTNLLFAYWELADVKVDESKSWYHKNFSSIRQDEIWLLEQKRLSGLAFFNYKQLCLDHLDCSDFISNQTLSEPIVKGFGCLGGVVSEAFERRGAKGKYCKLIIESNYEFHNVTIWSEEWEKLDVDVNDLPGSILLIQGNIAYDERYTQSNQIVATEKGKIKFIKSL